MPRITTIALVFVSLCVSSPGWSADETSSDTTAAEAEIRAVLDQLNSAWQDRDVELIRAAYVRSQDLISVGVDHQGVGWEALQNAVRQQSEIVRDYETALDEQTIVIDETGTSARYCQTYSLSFRVDPFTFHIPAVRETGVLSKVDGAWRIIQQHASAGVSNALWPAYMVDNQQDVTAYDVDHQFSVEALQEDFDLLLLALEEAHAGLYRYTDPPAFRQLAQATQARIARPMTLCQYYRLLAPVVAGIKCGHTAFDLPRQYYQHVREHGRYFPLQLRFLAGQAYVVGNAPSQDVPLGSQIVSINGRALIDVLNRLFACLRVDGDVVSARYRQLDDSFSEKYHLLVDQPETFEIVYRDRHGQSQTAVLPGVSYQELKDSCRNYHPSIEGVLDFQIRGNPPVAILTVRKFVREEIEDHHGPFTAYLDAVFTEIRRKKMERLIIDLRGNGGGDVGHQLLPYVIDEPVQYYRLIDTQRTRYSFLEYTDNGVFFNRVHPRLWNRIRNRDHRYELKGDYHLRLTPSPVRFTGKPVVLIDGNSFSAAAEFAAVVHYHDRATFIGEESGGAYYGNNAGDALRLTLPHTKLRLHIPIRRYVMAVSDYATPARGILPDHEVTPTIEDILNRRDSVLEFAMSHIAN